MRSLRLLQLLARQEGIALIMSLGVLVVLTVAGGTAMYYTTANERSSQISRVDQTVFNLAEAGLNDSLALLSNPANNPMNPWAFCASYGMPLPCYRTSTYEGGTVTWGGTLDEPNAKWTITSTAVKANPTGSAAANVKRVLTAKVPIQPAAEQTNTALAWNYIFSHGTGSTCDMTLEGSVQMRTRIMVSGNLCLEGSATHVSGELLVGGQVKNNSSSANIGASGAPITRADVAGGCKYLTGSVHSPCQGPPGNADHVWATTITTTPALQPTPNPDWDSWYLNANPGPYYPCQVTSGTPPTFENQVVDRANPNPALRNRSVLTDFNLTPSSSYTCRTGVGEISWNYSTKVLTVQGTIFIDGDAYISRSARYTGQANLYLSGSFKNSGSYYFCAVLSGGTGSECNFNSGAWNPNDTLLTVITNGAGGQGDMNATESILIGSSSQWQGALYGGPYQARIDSSVRIAGPIISDEVIVLSSIEMEGFSTISEVVPGMPGNSTVYSQPDKPELFSG